MTSPDADQPGRAAGVRTALRRPEWLSDMYDNVLRHRNVMDEETYGEWRRYMKKMYATGPALRDFLTTECGWYTDLYHELAGASAPCAARS